MMCKKNSSRWAAAKSLLVLPIVALSLTAFATTVYVPRQVQNKVTENSTKEQTPALPKSLDSVKVVTTFADKAVSGYERLEQNEEFRVMQEEFAKLQEQLAEQSKSYELHQDEFAIFQEQLAERGKSYAQYKDEFAKLHEQLAERSKEYEQHRKEFDKLRTELAERNEALKADLAKFAELHDSIVTHTPYAKAEKMPTFQGGHFDLFRNWIQSSVRYPEEAVKKGISGSVLFGFVVEKDGSTSSFEIVATPDKLLSDEVERVFKSSPKEWAAGEIAGEKVSVKFVIPIAFVLKDDAKTASAPSDKDVVRFDTAVSVVDRN